jgi:hypothetical protein
MFGYECLAMQCLAMQCLAMQLCYMHHREMLQLISTLSQVVTRYDLGGASPKSCFVIDAQWVAVRNGVLEQVESRKRQLALAAAPESLGGADAKCHPVAVGPSRFVAMIDVSGSMIGTPMHVAIAMGILTSELAHGAFRDKVLLFAEEPSWIDLSGRDRLVGKINIITRCHFGYTTNFYRAMELICAVVRENNLGAHEIPDLLVISDMQFNDTLELPQYTSAANIPKLWKTCSENIRKMFSDLGVELSGNPFEPPQLVFWNVRSDTVGYPAAAEDRGVIMLSGYSPALMKFVISGEMTEETIADIGGTAVKERHQITPREALRKILDDFGLEDVRVALNAMPAASFMCA